MKNQDHIDESAAKAIVFLHQRNDHKNKAMVTAEDLVIVRKSKPHFYKIENIKSLSFRQRKFLLPLVAGGILTPLGIVAMFGNYFNPYIVVLLILTGIYLLYEGFVDRWSLNIQGFSNEESISLLYVSDNLRAFIDFVSGHLPHVADSTREKGYLYLVIPETLWKTPDQEGPIDLGSAMYQAYTQEQWVRSKRSVDPDQVVLVADPWRAPVRIHYENDRESGMLRPHITGLVPRETIVNVL
jgi:hypothetical protein